MKRRDRAHVGRGGAKVAIFDLNPELGEAPAAGISGLFLPVDVADEDGVARALDIPQDAHGVSRILVNCAGIGPPGKAIGRDGAPMPLAGFARIVTINLIGTFNMLSKFAARLQHAPPIGEERGMEMRGKARAAGVLTPHMLPDSTHLTQRETARVLRMSGVSLLVPLANNTAAPGEGNMYLLHKVGSAAHRERFLKPLVEGAYRSAFSMTEPAELNGAGSDPSMMITTCRPSRRWPGSRRSVRARHERQSCATAAVSVLGPTAHASDRRRAGAAVPAIGRRSMMVRP